MSREVFKQGTHLVIEDDDGRFSVFHEGRRCGSVGDLQSAIEWTRRNDEFWEAKLAIKDAPTTVRANGEHWSIGDERPSHPSVRGCAGAAFEIEFFDGRRVHSTNMWYQGTIPSNWRDRLPDNARFIPAGRSNATRSE